MYIKTNSRQCTRCPMYIQTLYKINILSMYEMSYVHKNTI